MTDLESTLDGMRRRHVAREYTYFNGIGVSCGDGCTGWPCDTSKVLAAVDAITSLITEWRTSKPSEFTPDFRDGMDQMANDVEIALLHALGVES